MKNNMIILLHCAAWPICQNVDWFEEGLSLELQKTRYIYIKVGCNRLVPVGLKIERLTAVRIKCESKATYLATVKTPFSRVF